jgi:hypothetical protein
MFSRTPAPRLDSEAFFLSSDRQYSTGHKVQSDKLRPLKRDRQYAGAKASPPRGHETPCWLRIVVVRWFRRDWSLVDLSLAHGSPLPCHPLSAPTLCESCFANGDVGML